MTVTVEQQRLSKLVGSSVAFARNEGMPARDAVTCLVMAASVQAMDCGPEDAKWLATLVETFRAATEIEPE